ncbi:M3 family metallopeptidase [Sphingomonas natans]|uniref:M3 family metallopeptidase n=1 Tax=Sphingomonas natans TaxID=3063330 RepID=UPI0026E27524|nr:M3 family metallopeptidase [Sphingomonas sp. BIUV-7]
MRAWDGPFGAPSFDAIHVADFLPAFEIAIAEHRREIDAITADPTPPGFDTVIAAMERAGERLSRVRRLFWMLASARSDDAIRSIEGDVSAMLSRHGASIDHDPTLFARVAAVHLARERLGLDAEQLRLTEKVHRGFVWGGAALEGEAKLRFAAIDERLAALSIRFGQNVLAATAGWTMLLDAQDLSGIPADVCEGAAQKAKSQGHEGRFLFTLDRGDFEVVLTYSDRRDIRERMWRAFTGRCDGGEHDNRPIIAEMLRLRQESARLLGYACYADYRLDGSMAAGPEAADALLRRVWAPARTQALAEGAVLQEMIDAEGGGFMLAAWDWRYHAERVRRAQHQVDMAAIRSHLRLGAVRDAAFAVAGRLYGLRFEQRPELPVYAADVLAWAVTNADGADVGLLYTDHLARADKHGGAWMGSLRVQEKMDGPVTPIVYVVANFARAADPLETALSLDEARTLFHEFGHALHMLLSDVTYPSLAGTAVARDFVEFPSKLMEHWIVAPEILRDLGMPEELIEAIGRVDDFGQGFATVELTASSIVDLAIHRADADGLDPAEFERRTLAEIGMPDAIAMRHRLPHFTHVFDGGYASAYYSYLWSEVLDEDAFGAFIEAGNVFDRGVAVRLRREVLAPGDSRDPLQSYIAFRGRAPDEAPLLAARRLIADGGIADTAVVRDGV